MEQVLGKRATAPVYETGRPGPLWEQGIALVWFLVTMTNIPFATPLRYLCVLYYIGTFCWYYRDMLPPLVRAWPIILLPAMALMSFSWSDYPSAAINGGVFRVITVLIIVVLIQRMTLTQLFRTLMLAGIVITLYALALGDLERGAPFTHKNQLAVHMMLTLILTLWSALDRSLPLWHRSVGALFSPICLFIVLATGSATSLVVMALGVSGILAARFFWTDFGHIRHFRTLVTLFALAIVLAAVPVIAGLPMEQIYEDFVISLGKDPSLTGRTDIWMFADLAAKERPWLGHGLGGFWQYDVSLAQTININDHKPVGSNLGFHNAFLEVRVDLGYIGLGIFLFTIAWLFSRTLRAWLVVPSMLNSAALIIALCAIVFSFAESLLTKQFNMLVHLYYLPALAAFGASYRRYIGDATLTELPSEVPGGRLELVGR